MAFKVYAKTSPQLYFLACMHFSVGCADPLILVFTLVLDAPFILNVASGEGIEASLQSIPNFR